MATLVPAVLVILVRKNPFKITGCDIVSQHLLQRVSMGFLEDLDDLCAAVETGSLELTEKILEACPTIRPRSFGRPLEIAAEQGRTDITGALVSALIKYPLNQQDRELSDMQRGDVLLEAINIALDRRDRATIALLLPAYLDRSHIRACFTYSDNKTLERLDSSLLETFPTQSILGWIHVAEMPDALRRCLSDQLERTSSDMLIRLGEDSVKCRREVMEFWSPYFKAKLSPESPMLVATTF